jgi:serine/threonine-protein phosphatase 2A regulatory subunit B
VGDRGGRVICFEQVLNDAGQTDFEYLTEFQAHTKSFDVLASHEISESISAIEWINAKNSAQPALLASNSRSVKLYRIVTKQVKKIESVKKKLAKGKILSMPKMRVESESKEGKLVATFKTGKEQHLHSVSLAADGENFLTADESRINLWNIEHRAQHPVYNLVDYNRHKVTEEDEMIVSSRFDSSRPMFVYTTTNGSIRLCDFRESSSF